MSSAMCTVTNGTRKSGSPLESRRQRVVEAAPLPYVLSVPPLGDDPAPVLCFLHGYDEAAPLDIHPRDLERQPTGLLPIGTVRMLRGTLPRRFTFHLRQLGHRSRSGAGSTVSSMLPPR
jgi:hypothetical protein